MGPSYISRKLAVSFLGILLSIAILHATNVMRAEAIGYIVPFFCPFEAITGIQCPGCGMTRAVLSITAGDLGRAYQYNPFVFLLLFIVITSVLPTAWKGRIFANSRLAANAFFSIALAGVLIFWFVQRLLPSI